MRLHMVLKGLDACLGRMQFIKDDINSKQSSQGSGKVVKECSANLKALLAMDETSIKYWPQLSCIKPKSIGTLDWKST